MTHPSFCSSSIIKNVFNIVFPHKPTKVSGKNKLVFVCLFFCFFAEVTSYWGWWGFTNTHTYELMTFRSNLYKLPAIRHTHVHTHTHAYIITVCRLLCCRRKICHSLESQGHSAAATQTPTNFYRHFSLSVPWIATTPFTTRQRDV